MEPPHHIIRRAEFVLNEARLPDGRYDQATKYALRVISNWVAVGADLGSADVKLANSRMSVAARDLRSTMSAREWCSATVNEHPEPMRVVWGWARERASDLTAKDIVERMAAHPMVTITKEEDRRLRQEKLASSGDPLERYRRAKIAIFTCEDPASFGFWPAKRRSISVDE